MIKPLTLVEQAVLYLCRKSLKTLKGESDIFDFSKLGAKDWDEVIKECSIQSVSLMCFDATDEYKDYVPKELYSAWFEKSALGLVKNFNVLNAQNQLVSLLDNNKLDYIILKGFASASYYPDFEKRAFGDVDFLISPNQQERVERVLLEAGYTKSSDEHICHRVFRKPKSNLEMHFEVAGIPNGQPGEIFREYFKNATEKYTVNINPNFHNPLPEIHAVVLLLHTIHHMLGEGIGLRQLCDWACFVNKTYKEDFWQKDVLPLLRKTGTYKFASTITKTASIYLGTACPNWAEWVDEALCSAVMEDIFSAGNLGKKDFNRSGSGQMISRNGKSGTRNGKVKNLLLTLKDTMYISYPFLRKWWILYPFVFVFRIFRYLVLMLIGKRPDLLKANTYANERLSLYKQFELYDNEF